MPVSYAGIQLDVTTPELRQWIGDHLQLDYGEFAPRLWPGKNLTHLGFTAMAPYQPIRIGRLMWPTRAARFSVGHYLIPDKKVAALRPLVYGSSGNSYLPKPLSVSDGHGGQITAQKMYALPLQPLSQFLPQQNLGSQGLQLLTLVDARFFWWFKAAAISVTGGTTAWTDLYASIGTALGVSIAVDPIPAAYLKPDPALATNYEALPLLLDAVAASVGQVIVAGLDGSIKAQNAVSAQNTVRSNLRLFQRREAGGVFALDAKG